MKSLLERYFAHFEQNPAGILSQSGPSGALILCQALQLPPCKVQIGQCTENKQGVRILGEAAISDLGESKYTLHNPKDMLDLRSDFRLGTVAQSVVIRQRFMPAAFRLSKILGAGCATLNRFTLACIGRVAPDACLITVQQIPKYLRIVNIGGRRRHRMDDFGFAVDANVRLHSKVPLVAFLGLVHLRVSRFLFVLGRIRCIDNAGIHNGAIGNFHPLILKIFPDRAKQLIAQFMPLQQVAKIENGRFIRNRLAPEIDADKSAHGPGFIQRLFSTGVRQIEPVLQKVDAQHALQANGRSTITGPGVERLDNLTQLAPGYDTIHLGKKLLSPGWLAIALKIARCKGLLFHQYQPVQNSSSIIANVGT